jgi:hypothetical protein
MSSAIELYKQAALTTDQPKDGLKSGDVGTVVEILPHPSGGPRGIILEVFNVLGDTVAVVTVPETQVQPLTADEVWAVRRLAQAG